MMSNQTLPVSAIVKAKNVEEPKKKTREDWRKAKELEEARKAGTAPAAVDEEGKDINPHIPQYIAQAPWYFGAGGPTLKHQRPQPEKQREFSKLDEWYSRGVQVMTFTKFRKGACENCGAMTHKKKDCMERPRKVGARFTGDDIAPDEHSQPNLALDYDGKRDRWNGYNPEEHRVIVEEFAKIEEAKRSLKAEKLKQDHPGEAASEKKDVDSDADEDEDKYVDDIDMPGTKVDSKQRITVRNLRIREDTAKYLRNLDPNSAYYDPKTRSMRDNPYKNTGKTSEEVQFAGDNFVRITGDTQKHSKAQLFAWEAYEKGVDVHLLAEPTKLELLNKEFDKRKVQFKETIKDSILEKYGGAKHLQVPPRELLLAQSEQYVEYSRHGKVVKGMEKAIVRSKYEEDIFINNHNSVWGSYWKDGFWGFKCCHSMVKNSYCTGEAGKSSLEEDSILAPLSQRLNSEEEDEDEPATLLEQHQEKLLKKQQKKKDKKKKLKEKKRQKKKKQVESSSSESESESADSDDEETKKRKLRLALLMEEESKRQADRVLAMDERKRPYNSMYEVHEPTKEEMEAYYMKKSRSEDPMADFLGQKWHNDDPMADFLSKK